MPEANLYVRALNLFLLVPGRMAHETFLVKRLFWKMKARGGMGVGVGECRESDDSSSHSKFSKFQLLSPVKVFAFPRESPGL